MERTEENTRASGPVMAIEGHYLDWPAIFGGCVVAVAVGTVFTGFGGALGLSTISAKPGEGSFNFMLIISAVWIVITLVSSYMAGGYVAGRMRRRVDQATADEVTVRDGINGLVVWALGIVATAFLLGAAVSTTIHAAGSVISGAGAVASTVASTAGAIVGDAASGAVVAVGAVASKADPMSYTSSALLRPNTVATGTNDAAATATQTAAILANVLKTGSIADDEKAYLVSAVSAATGATQPEASAKVDAAVTAATNAKADAEKAVADAKAKADQVAADAKAAAIKTAEVARVSTILSAFLLASAALVAAAASYVGAVRGGRHRDEGRIFGGFAYRG